MTSATSQSHATAGRLAALDLLRLVAALAVVAYHYLFRGAAGEGWVDAGYPELAGMAIYGYLGVNLFFLISGFVIAWSAEGRGAMEFALSRFARLYPGFLVCMSLTAGIMALAADPQLPVTMMQWTANLAIFSPALGRPFIDGVYWSIVLELIFYGWMVLAIATGQFQKRPMTLVAAWLAVAAINEFAIDSRALRMLFVTEYAGWFAAGIAAYAIRRGGSRGTAYAILVAAFTLALATAFRGREWMLGHYGLALSDTALIVSVFALFALFLAGITLGGRVRASGTTLLLGALTYPLYLLHQNIGYLALNAFEPLVGRWFAVAAVTLAVLAASALVCTFIETPARRFILRKLRPLTVMPFRSGHADKPLVVR